MVRDAALRLLTMRVESYSPNLERALPQPRHIRRPRSRCRPVKPAIFLRDRDVVDRRFSALHQPVLVELPLLVAVGAIPLAAGVVPFVLEAHRDAVAVEAPEILDQAILLLLLPFAGEERDDGLAALKDFRAIAPAAVLGIGERDARGVARIPGVLGHTGFLRGGLPGDRRKRRARHDGRIR